MKDAATAIGRAFWQERLTMALENGDPSDTAALCAAYLGQPVEAFPLRPMVLPMDEARAKDACDALEKVHRDLAVQICLSFLTGTTTQGPQHDVFGRLQSDAENWAQLAPSHEVSAYTVAGLRQLGQRAIGHKLRRDVFAAMWQDMRPEDKAAFLKAVGAA